MRTTIVIFFLAFSFPLLATITLPKVIASKMVIQRNMPFTFYGNSTSEEIITITFRDQTMTTVPVDGKWSMHLEGIEAGGPYQVKINGDNEIILEDIYFGDVYLIGGDSHMEHTLDNIQDSSTIYKEFDLQKIRVFNVDQEMANMPRETINSKAGWQKLNPHLAQNTSAIGAIIGKTMFNKLNIPIGIIDISWANTDLASFMSKHCFNDQSSYLNQIQLLENANLNQLSKKSIQLNELSDTIANLNIRWHNQFPTAKFNAMIYPLINQKLTAVIWFQGKEDLKFSGDYGWKFIRFINDVRNHFDQNHLPFLFTMLPSISNDAISDDQCGNFRTNQMMALHLTNTAMVNPSDLSVNHSIDYKSIAERYIYPLESLCYGKKIDYSGPQPIKAERNEEGYLITFNHFDKSLMALYGEKITGFKVPHPNLGMTEAHGKIVSSNQVQVYTNYPIPGMIKYLWQANFNQISLYNSLGNPAPPFELMVND